MDPSQNQNDPLARLRELGVDVGEATSLADLTPEQITAAESALQARFDEARESRNIDLAEQIVESIEALRAENTAREEAATAAEQRLAELGQRIEPAPAEPEAVEPEPEAQPEPQAAEPAPQPQAVAAAAPATAPSAPAAAPKARTTSAPMPKAPAARSIQPDNSGPVAHATVTAAASLSGGIKEGQVVTDLSSLGKAAGEGVEAMLRMGSRGFLPIAHVEVAFPEDRTMGLDERSNRDKLEAVTASMHASNPQELVAVTAAGGLCAPVAVRYEMDTISDDARPIRDALPRFGADRGGVRGIRPPVLSDLAGAVDVFTEEEDTNGPTKPCLDVSCGSSFEEFVDAVTKCLEVGNWQKRTFIENFNAYWTLATAQHAREAEVQLWDRMVALSIDVTAGDDAATQLGAFRQLVSYLSHARAAIVSRDRTARDLTFRTILPAWVVDWVSIDLLRQLPGDDTYAVTEAELRASLAAHNIAATFSPDIALLPALVDGQTLFAWPDTVDALLYPEGTFAFLDGGELNFGMEIRDSTLNTTNDVRSMTETFEGVSRFGPRSVRLTMDLCASGASAGTRNYDPCTTGS